MHARSRHHSGTGANLFVTEWSVCSSTSDNHLATTAPRRQEHADAVSAELRSGVTGAPGIFAIYSPRALTQEGVVGANLTATSGE